MMAQHFDERSNSAGVQFAGRTCANPFCFELMVLDGLSAAAAGVSALPCAGADFAGVQSLRG